MLTLYGTAHSRSTRALWALEELQLPYDYVNVDLRHRRAGAQPLQALNPGRKVPVLKHNDFLLEEYRDRMIRRPALIRARERESVSAQLSRRPN
jgi:glutathione S-transferase